MSPTHSDRVSPSYLFCVPFPSQHVAVGRTSSTMLSQSADRGCTCCFQSLGESLSPSQSRTMVPGGFLVDALHQVGEVLLYS